MCGQDRSFSHQICSKFCMAPLSMLYFAGQRGDFLKLSFDCGYSGISFWGVWGDVWMLICRHVRKQVDGGTSDTVKLAQTGCENLHPHDRICDVLNCSTLSTIIDKYLCDRYFKVLIYEWNFSSSVISYIGFLFCQMTCKIKNSFLIGH